MGLVVLLPAVGLSWLLVLGYTHLARTLGWGKKIRAEEPAGNQAKRGTPTMGGIAIVISALLAWVLVFRIGPEAVALAFLTIGYLGLGIIDDYAGIEASGLKARVKLAAQLAIAIIFAIYATGDEGGIFLRYLAHQQVQPARIGWKQGLIDQFLFNFGEPQILLAAWLDVALYTLVVTVTVNAVNFTDGLDGLAAGTVAAALWPFAGDNLFAWSLMGSCLGFLWHNVTPAKVFMGDAGSHALGAALAGAAILGGAMLWLPLSGAVFAIEILSVMIQVTSFRLFGRRVFRMSPFHYHLALGGWSETQIVTRTWMVAILLALVTGAFL